MPVRSARETFYGHSFIADEWGDLIAEVEDGEPAARRHVGPCPGAHASRRHGLLRDRRPDLYVSRLRS